MSESEDFWLLIFFLGVFEANNGTHCGAISVPKLVGS